MGRNQEMNSWIFVGWILLLNYFTNILADSKEPASFSDFKFSIEPSDVIALKHQPALLNCSAEYGGSKKPEMQWIRDGVFMNFEGDTRRYKLSNGSLFFSEIVHSRDSRPDEGIYQCVASVAGLGTIVSRTVKLQVAYIARSFTQEPVTQQLRVGETAMFRCLIDGAPPPQITWFKEDYELKQEDSNINLQIYPEGVLEISDIKPSDVGRYRCKAVNADRWRMSSYAALTLLSGQDSLFGVSPTFVMVPRDKSVLEGTTVTLFCAANGLDRLRFKPTILWLKDGKEIDMSDLDSRFSLVGPTTSNLQISEVLEEDAGLYTCRASNNVDSNDADATLTVHVKPRFVTKPHNMYAHVSADVRFDCNVYSVPPPTIQWMKNGDVVIPSDYFQIINDRDLKILGLVNSDDGLYQCVASNVAGTIQASAQLVILQPDVPIPTLRPHTTPTPAGQTEGVASDLPGTPRQLAAAIVSTRFVTLSWREPLMTGESIINNYSVYWKETGSNRERVTNTSATELNIQHLKPSTRYEFRVLAYNSLGPGRSMAEITVETQPEVNVPSSPRELRAFPLSPSVIKVMWRPPEKPNGAITNYKLYYYKVGAEEETDVSVNGLEKILSGLKGFTEYSFRVVAFNSNGPGMSTEEVNSRTYSDVPSAVPQNVTIETDSSTSIVIRWEPPSEENRNGIITGYKIRYKREGARRGETFTTAGDLRVYTIADLQRHTTYVVRISAMTVNGSGPATEWLRAETFISDLDESTVPGQPSSLRVRPLPTSIVVSWTPPVNTEVKIRGYKIGYGKGIPDVHEIYVDAKQRYYTLRNLEPGSEYVISLRANNNKGFGVPSLETVSTRQKAQEESATPMIPPVGLKAIVLSSSTIVVTWSDSTLGRNQRITDIRYYTVKYNAAPYNKKPKYINSTDLNVHIEDLKPNTEYEFSVKVIKGKRQSTWSLSVTNRTFEGIPQTAPRDLTTIRAARNPSHLILNWQPPRVANGQVTGYLVFYTTDATRNDRDWVVEGVLGDKLTVTIKGLTPETTYYFKVQARNSKGYGPFSSTAIYSTPKSDGTGGGPIKTPGILDPPLDAGDNTGNSKDNQQGSSGGISTNTLWIIIACIAGVTIIAIVGVIVFLCKRRMDNNSSERRSKYKPAKTAAKSGPNKDLKPPDLWIHDQMELKNMDRSQQEPLMVTTIPQDMQQNPEEMPLEMDKRRNSFISDSAYDSQDDRYRRALRPKPIMIPVDAQPAPPREPIATALPNGHLSGDDSLTRPVYPRTNYYSSTPRVHAGDSSLPSSGLQSPTSPSPQNELPPIPYDQLSLHSSRSDGTDGTNKSLPPGPRPQHPLKSFTVPGPPPHLLNQQSAPSTPAARHIDDCPPDRIVRVKPQQPSSPFKKPPASLMSANFNKNRPPLPVISPRAPDVTMTGNLGNPDIQTSTEELTQEMANLEGIMKNLNAITQAEFEC